MRALRDPDQVLGAGLDAIRQEFQLPAGFPPAAVAEAGQAAAGARAGTHHDRTALPFVTLDPQGSRDLDQAFAIEPAGSDIILHYAIADVGWFVEPGGAMDREAWERGTSLYLPDGKVPLYPPALGDDAASLLPDGDRPAIILNVRIMPDGRARLDGAERSLIRSRAKLAYETVQEHQLPGGFAELVARIEAEETARGAARVDPPEQEVALTDGRFGLRFRSRTWAEGKNAAMSLAANMAVADALHRAGTGLFRTMAEPHESAVRRLRNTAKALGIDWPKSKRLEEVERALDPSNPTHASLMLAIRRASPGAAYAPYRPGERPWHAAVAATYSHATAPLRRLADRYVLEAALAVAKGERPADSITAAFEQLPDVMTRADAVAGQVERAVIDLAEAVALQGREGQQFRATVTDTDHRGARIQLAALPIVTRVQSKELEAGQELKVLLERADPASRSVQFSLVG